MKKKGYKINFVNKASFGITLDESFSENKIIKIS